MSERAGRPTDSATLGVVIDPVGLGSLPAPRAGRVESFDEAAGLGWILGESGERRPFHCTAIADGTRTIPVGTAVRFHLAASGRGRLEAAAITPS